jgi:hypothetical protein
MPTLSVGVFTASRWRRSPGWSRPFGFARSMGKDRGRCVNACRDAVRGRYLIVDSEWALHVASPASLGGENMQFVYIRTR